MLRIASENDEEYLYRLYMHPAINPWLLYEFMPASAFAPIIGELLERRSIHIFDVAGISVGMCKLVPQKHRNSHIVYLGGVAIDPDHSGKGFGSQMIREVIQKAKESGSKRIELTVSTENKRAIHLYESSGFLSEGILRNYTYLKSEGRFIDEQVMGLLL